MIEKTYKTRCGTIHYWISDKMNKDIPTLVFLPGLTADHRLFEKQVEYFEGKYNVFVWDAPGHAASWPFSFNFDLMDKARWLDEILCMEGVDKPIIVGQSMGGYVGQTYDGDQKRYAKLSGHGFRMLAEAMEKDLPYEIKCPAVLICGEKDHAGSCVRYNKAWHKNTGIPIHWIKDAGHNSNTDAPEVVNAVIEALALEVL